MDQRLAFILSNNAFLNRTLGVPATPYEVARRQVDMTRRMGRTWEMIRSLPEDGHCVVMIWRMSHRDHYRQTIRDVRGGEYPVQNVRFITYRDWVKGDHNLRGLPPLPAFVDNAVLDMASLEIAERFADAFWNPPKAEEATIVARESESNGWAPTESIIAASHLIEDLYRGPICDQSTPTTTDGSAKSSSKSRKRSKRSATDTDTSSQS